MVNHDISPWSRTCHKSPLRWHLVARHRRHGAKAGMENPTLQAEVSGVIWLSVSSTSGRGRWAIMINVLGRISYNLQIQKRNWFEKKQRLKKQTAQCKFYGASNLMYPTVKIQNFQLHGICLHLAALSVSGPTVRQNGAYFARNDVEVAEAKPWWHGLREKGWWLIHCSCETGILLAWLPEIWISL